LSFRYWRGHSQSINSICFSNTGKYIATNSQGKDLKIWDSANQKLIRNIITVRTVVRAHFCVVDTNEYIALINDNNFLEVWNPNTGKLMNAIKESQEIRCSSLSSDGIYIFTSIGYGFRY
jgi:WD40 repeat protein